jgi:hypothetical protein
MKPNVVRGFYSKPHVGEIDSQFTNSLKNGAVFDVGDLAPPLSADGGALKIQCVVRLERETGITR